MSGRAQATDRDLLHPCRPKGLRHLKPFITSGPQPSDAIRKPAIRVVTCGGAPVSGSLVRHGARALLAYLDSYVTTLVHSCYGSCAAGPGGREPAGDAGDLDRRPGHRG